MGGLCRDGLSHTNIISTVVIFIYHLLLYLDAGRQGQHCSLLALCLHQNQVGAVASWHVATPINIRNFGLVTVRMLIL